MLLLVRDELSGADFGQEEERVGYNTGGEYQVRADDHDDSDDSDNDDDDVCRSVCQTEGGRSSPTP